MLAKLDLDRKNDTELEQEIHKKQKEILDLYNKTWFNKNYNTQNFSANYIKNKFIEEVKNLLKANKVSKVKITEILNHYEAILNGENEDTSVEGGNNPITRLKNGYNYILQQF